MSDPKDIVLVGVGGKSTPSAGLIVQLVQDNFQKMRFQIWKMAQIVAEEYIELLERDKDPTLDPAKYSQYKHDHELLQVMLVKHNNLWRNLLESPEIEPPRPYDIDYVEILQISKGCAGEYEGWSGLKSKQSHPPKGPVLNRKKGWRTKQRYR